MKQFTNLIKEGSNTDEIERKFLIKGDFEIPENSNILEIEQGFISIDPVVRIRKSNNDYTLTVKGKGHISRPEVEKEITKEEFDCLWDLTEGNRMQKTRYEIEIPNNNHPMELDVFKGDLDGLNLFEIEFDTLDIANNYDMSQINWLEFKDVSEDPKFKNSNLSTKERFQTLSTLDVEWEEYN